MIAPSLQTSSAICSRSCGVGEGDALHHHVDRVADRDRRAVADHAARRRRSRPRLRAGRVGARGWRRSRSCAASAAVRLSRSQLGQPLLALGDTARSISASVTGTGSASRSASGRSRSPSSTRLDELVVVVGSAADERAEQALGVSGAGDARDDQVLARAGGGDVEQAQPFGVDVLLLLLPGVVVAGGLEVAVAAEAAGADAEVQEVLVLARYRLGVVAVLAAEVGERDDRILEALGAVDGHDPHDVVGLLGDGRLDLDLLLGSIESRRWRMNGRSPPPPAAANRRAWSTIASRFAAPWSPSGRVSANSTSRVRSTTRRTRLGEREPACASGAGRPARRARR